MVEFKAVAIIPFHKKRDAPELKRKVKQLNAKYSSLECINEFNCTHAPTQVDVYKIAGIGYYYDIPIVCCWWFRGKLKSILKKERQPIMF